MKLSIWILALSFNIASCDNSKNSDPGIFHEHQKKDKEKKKGKKAAKRKSGSGRLNSNNILIEETWEMPGVLTEISGIVWYGENKLAAIQDETGIIFIYNLLEKKIEKELSFAGKGDYEGIALAQNIFYILRSDGTIIEVQGTRTTKEYGTSLNIKNDTEGIVYDNKNNRLLISLKASESNTPGAKTIYAFNLTSRSLNPKPILAIDLTDEIFSKSKGKKKEIFQPSDIAIHPLTGEMYVIDGSNSSLLILSRSGDPHSHFSFNGSEFPQPEGIAFSPTGELYISSEGVKGKGKIMKINLTINNKKEEL